MNYRTLRLSLDGPVARLTLAQPATSNRIDARALVELADAAEAISNAPGIVVAVLDADGPDFCAGWDPAARDDLLARRAQGEPSLVDPFGPLAALACPLLVATQGAVTSAGLELALVGDIRVAADDARFALPEVEDGLLPLAGGSQRLPRIVGRGRAAAMLLLGETLDADAAYRAGLVSRVVPRADLESETQSIAQRIAGRGPLGLRFAKEAVHRGADLPLDHALRLELDLSLILQTTHDRAEGVQSFLENRPPNFEGH